jgi:hypothetical protein
VRTAGLLLALALAGCSGAAPTPAPGPSPSPSATALVSDGWTGVWRDPQATLTVLGRIGLRPGPYARSGDAFRSESIATSLSDPSFKPVNTAVLVASGTERQLDRLQFTLDLPHTRAAGFSRGQFVRWVGQALDRLGVPGKDQVVPLIAAEQAGEGELPGARWAVAREGGDRATRLIVTFSRPAARAGTDA